MREDNVPPPLESLYKGVLLIGELKAVCLEYGQKLETIRLMAGESGIPVIDALPDKLSQDNDYILGVLDLIVRQCVEDIDLRERVMRALGLQIRRL
ncbi:MAG: hypothetical protein KGJ01_02350 [Patescibacteria group bacterium]|nr:hypothetical protein [Patescibacteria group bacterium]